VPGHLVAKVGTSKAGGTMSQQAAVHLWLAADAHGNKQTTDAKEPADPIFRVSLSAPSVEEADLYLLTLC
jgi:hypothetical protein